jgi:hypothetical protein
MVPISAKSHQRVIRTSGLGRVGNLKALRRIGAVREPVPGTAVNSEGSGHSVAVVWCPLNLTPNDLVHIRRAPIIDLDSIAGSPADCLIEEFTT